MYDWWRALASTRTPHTAPLASPPLQAPTAAAAWSSASASSRLEGPGRAADASSGTAVVPERLASGRKRQS